MNAHKRKKMARLEHFLSSQKTDVEEIVKNIETSVKEVVKEVAELQVSVSEQETNSDVVDNTTEEEVVKAPKKKKTA